MNRNEAVEALQDARDATQAAQRAYKAAWATGRTVKLEVALDVLRDAEASERAVEAEVQPFLAEA